MRVEGLGCGCPKSTSTTLNYLRSPTRTHPRQPHTTPTSNPPATHARQQPIAGFRLRYSAARGPGSDPSKAPGRAESPTRIPRSGRDSVGLTVLRFETCDRDWTSNELTLQALPWRAGDTQRRSRTCPSPSGKRRPWPESPEGSRPRGCKPADARRRCA